MLVALFVFATILFVLVITGVRPPLTHRSPALRPPWFPAMLVNELAPLILFIVGVSAMGMVLVGDAGQPMVRVGLVLLGLSAVGLVWMIVKASRSGTTLDRAMPLSVHRSSISLARAVWPYPYRLPGHVEVVGPIEYTPGYHLDLYERSQSERRPRPVMIHVHGGSWSGGSRGQQARPFIHELAGRDWAVLAIDYPLVPEATYPENLAAVHSAIGWARANAGDFGFDTSRIFITGGSSGAHLAAMAALTDRDESVGSVGAGYPALAGAVVLYGVYDLMNRHGIRDEWPIVAEGLIKADRRHQPELFVAASPVDRVHEGAPRFIIIHGRDDSLVPFAESVNFAEALRAVSRRPVDLVLLHGASHGFDAVPSIRTQHLANHLAAVLDTVATP